jgi:hypothetical protein
MPVEAWFSTNRIEDSWLSKKRIRGVVIDPERGYPDVDRLNNEWPRNRP